MNTLRFGLVSGSSVYACLLLYFLTTAVPAQAQSGTPAISGTTGTFSEGGTVTISGSNFGSKSTAAPFKWDNFQTGTPPNLLSTSGPHPWSLYSSVPGSAETRQYSPAYSSSRSRFSGDITARQYFAQRPEGYTSNVSLYLTDAPAPLYMSGWLNYSMSPDSTMRNLKIFQHNAGEWTAPTTRWDLYPVTNSAHITSERCAASEYVINKWGDGLPSRDAWHRLEVWHNRTSTNEHMQVFMDGAKIYDQQFAHNACPQNSWYIMSYADRETATGSEFLDWYWSELYVDNTLARVEIGNASTYAASTHREIQIPSSWSAGSIQVKINKGSFPSGQTAWLYVLDSNGVSNAQGYPISFGGGDSVAPGVPTNVNVTP